MPRATIDLSWLPGLLTPTPQATPNDLYGAQQEQPYYDEKTGKYSSAPAYTDNSGTEIPGTLPKGADTQSFFVRPTKAQELFKPAQSEMVNRLNAEFASRPALQRLDDQTRVGIAEQHVRDLGDNYVYPGLDARRTALAGGGQFNSPTDVLAQSRAAGDLNAGMPATQTQTDVLQAQKNLAATKGELNRQPVVEAALDQSSVNQLAQLLKVDAPSIQLQAQRLQGELGRQPTYEEVRERILQNQLTEARDVTPLQLASQQHEAALQETLSRGRLALSPYLEGTQRNQAIAGLAESQNIPVQSPFGNRINPDSTISPVVRNPLGMSDIGLKMRTMSDATSPGSTGGTTTLPSGVTVGIKPRSPQPIDPLADAGMGQQATVHTPDATINTGARSATQRLDDIINTPVNTDFQNSFSESGESIKSNITSDIVRTQSQLDDTDLQTRAQMYPNSEYAQQYKALQQRLEELKKQLSENSGSAKTSKGRMPVYAGFSLPSSLQ